MDAPATYIQFSFILISVPNALLITLMVLLFIVALVAPFPGHHGIQEGDDHEPE